MLIRKIKLFVAVIAVPLILASGSLQAAMSPKNSGSHVAPITNEANTSLFAKGQNNLPKLAKGQDNLPKIKSSQDSDCS